MKRSPHSHLPYAVLSDRGLTRGHNEDNFAVTAFEAENDLIPASLLCVLCDGVGGNNAGEIASEMAVNGITTYIEGCDASAPLVHLTGAIQTLSSQVFEAAKTSPELHGMASTAACAWVIGQRLFTATVGDSRIYLIRGSAIQQISVDHTWIQEAREAGLIPETVNKNHPNAHVIRRFIGSENPPEVDTRLNLNNNPSQNNQGMLLQDGDIVFLCSDGISDLVQDHEILEILTKHPIEEAKNVLKQVVYQRGAYDNLTLIVVQVPKAELPASKKVKKQRMLLLVLLLIAAIATGIGLGWLVLHQARLPVADQPETSGVIDFIKQVTSSLFK